MLVVLDAGVFVSAAITPRGVASRIVAAGIAGSFEYVLCPRLVAEFANVLARPKINRFVSAPMAERFIGDVVGAGRDVADPTEVDALSRDPDDDYLVALAVEHHAEYVVTGDNDLLSLGRSPVPVLGLRAFLELLDATTS